MLTCYYAHCIAIYDTLQERRDLETLARLGFAPWNPNQLYVQAAVDALRRDGHEYMEFFKPLVLEHDVFAFRALPDGMIPAGVSRELTWAQDAGKPIIELPSGCARRSLSLGATREYLAEIGQR